MRKELITRIKQARTILVRISFPFTAFTVAGVGSTRCGTSLAGRSGIIARLSRRRETVSTADEALASREKKEREREMEVCRPGMNGRAFLFIYLFFFFF